MEPLALPSSSPTGSAHHLHRALLHSPWAFQSGVPPNPTPDMEAVSSYEASVVATSLLPPSENAWAHHPMLATPAPAQQHWIKQEPEEQAVNGHDDSGISPGRTSSSGPPSSGGSPPANNTNNRAAVPSPPNKPEHQDADEDCRSSPVTHDDDDSSEMSEDTMDSLSRLQMALSQSGSPLGDIYNTSDDQAIQCPLCPQSTSSLPSLAAHLASHVEHKSGSDTTELQCPVCTFSSSNKEDFVSHISSHYSNNDTSSSKRHSTRRCSVCDFTTKSATKLKCHLADVHGFAPGENDMDMPDEDPTTPRVNSQGKVKTFRCKQCNFVAVTKMDFWSHTRNHIKGEKVLSCPRCPFVTEYKHHLEYHLRNHSGSKPFKCSQCSYSCVNKSMLNSHLKSHSNVYQYRCADCNYATKYCHSLKLHLRKYTHAPAMVLNPDGSPNPLPIIDVYGTRRGPKTKKDPHQDSQHIGKQDKTPVVSIQPPTQAYLGETAEDIHKCAQCDFSTSSQEHFAQHLLTAHTNVVPKPRSPPILIPTPEKLLQQPHPIMIPQSNPMKEYLSWMYAQQQHAMDLYQQYKGAATLPEPLGNLTAPNPLDLSKEVRKDEPDLPVTNINNNNVTSPSPAPTNKNRRKGKAFKLERIAIQQDEDSQPPPCKLAKETSSASHPPAQYISPKPVHVLLSPSPTSNGVVRNLSDPCTEDRKSPEICSNGASPTLPLPCSDAQPTYNCSYCDILFRDVVMYTMHMGYHGYKDPFHCNMCGQQTSDKLAFFLHIARSSHS